MASRAHMAIELQHARRRLREAAKPAGGPSHPAPSMVANQRRCRRRTHAKTASKAGAHARDAGGAEERVRADADGVDGEDGAPHERPAGRQVGEDLEAVERDGHLLRTRDARRVRELRRVRAPRARLLGALHAADARRCLRVAAAPRDWRAAMQQRTASM
jgi:hypothetical protein